MLSEVECICMDSITTNISMPRGLYDQAKAQAKKYHYNSVSELIRDSLRWWMNGNLTRNGFTPEFEEEILRRSRQSKKNDIEWNGKESDLITYVEGKKRSKLHSRSKGVVASVSRSSRNGGYLRGAV